MSGSIFMHDFSQHAPDCVLGYGAPADAYDATLMGRIAAALRLTLGSTTAPADDVWTPIIARHQQFVDLLMTGRLRDANGLLARMFATPLTHGFEQSDGMHDLIVANPAHQQHVRQLA